MSIKAALQKEPVIAAAGAAAMTIVNLVLLMLVPADETPASAMEANPEVYAIATALIGAALAVWRTGVSGSGSPWRRGTFIAACGALLVTLAEAVCLGVGAPPVAYAVATASVGALLAVWRAGVGLSQDDPPTRPDGVSE